GARGPQAEFEDGAARRAPVVCKRVGAQAEECEIVRLFDCLREPRDEFVLHALCYETLAHLLQACAPAGRELCVGGSSDLCVRARGDTVVAAYHLCELARADLADLHGDNE